MHTRRRFYDLDFKLVYIAQITTNFNVNNIRKLQVISPTLNLQVSSLEFVPVLNNSSVVSFPILFVTLGNNFRKTRSRSLKCRTSVEAYHMIHQSFPFIYFQFDTNFVKLFTTNIVHGQIGIQNTMEQSLSFFE